MITEPTLENKCAPTDSPAPGGSEVKTYYEIGLVGGTAIRIQPGRGNDKAYDHLLAALEGSMTRCPRTGEWQVEWMRYAKKVEIEAEEPAAPVTGELARNIGVNPPNAEASEPPNRDVASTECANGGSLR